MSDESTERFLGRLDGKLDGIIGEQKAQRSDASKLATGMNKIGTKVATLEANHEAHREEVDRRFGEVATRVDSAHNKIARGTTLTTYGEPLPDGPPAERMSNGRKAGIGAGALTGIGVIITALANYLKG